MYKLENLNTLNGVSVLVHAGYCSLLLENEFPLDVDSKVKSITVIETSSGYLAEGVSAKKRTLSVSELSQGEGIDILGYREVYYKISNHKLLITSKNSDFSNNQCKIYFNY